MPDVNQNQPLTTTDKLRILIADDQTETRRTTRLMLSLIPQVEVVALAQDGQEAIALARKLQPDIALMDVNMPGISGLEAIAVMRQQQPDLASVVISAEQQRDTFQEAMAVGARGFLTKPYTSEQLIEVIERVGKVVIGSRRQVAEISRVQRERDLFLQELALEYIKTRRTDEKAMTIYEQLAQREDCDQRVLTSLAMIYVLRQEWSKLKMLAARLEKTA